MKRTLMVSLLAGVLNCSAAETYEIVVYGSTPAALSAAVQAKRMGKSCVVVSPETRIGGLTTGGLGQTDIGNKRAFGGIALEFYRAVADHYRDEANWKWQKRGDYLPDGQCAGTKGEDSMWTFEPSAALAILEAWEKRDGLVIHRGRRLCRERGKVKVEKGARGERRIVSFLTEDGTEYRGKVFVDATYEGDLMAAAGVSYAFGREANAQYGETLNGTQTAQARFHQFPQGVDPHVVPGDPKSGLLPNVEPGPIEPDGTGDRRVQAYCFRMCLTDNPANRIPFAKPEGYDERTYELLFRMFAAKPAAEFTGNLTWKLPWINSKMPNRKTDTNNRDAFSTDFIGRNWNWPDASYAEREAILAAHLKYQRGLMWTLANHPRVPEAVRKEVSRWGTCRDEFTDGLGDGWQRQLYVREARRMVGDYVVTELDCTKRRVSRRPVAMAAYNMDSHNVRRYVGADGFVHNEGDVEVRVSKGPYGIDYGAIVPKRGECANLFVPVCLSASHIAFGSIRMEPVFFALGQAAATAAAQTIDAGCAVQDLAYGPLAARLILDGQVLTTARPPAAVVDFSRTSGPVKPVNGINQPPMVGMPIRAPMFHYLKEAGIPYSRLHDVGGFQGQNRYVDIPNVFRNFDADENDPKNYDFAATDILVKRLEEQGVESFYRLGVTIENPWDCGLKLGSNERIVPPKDFAKWARICEHVIRHYTEGWANGFKYKMTYWEIWNEPENNEKSERNPMWQAPFEEYIRFYGVVAPYLKAKFPHLKIGGYGMCGFYDAVGSGAVAAAHSSPRTRHFIDCVHKFLKAARDNDWPLDFFSYHSYSVAPVALKQVRFADKLLNDYGFTREKTERVYNEWLPVVSHDSLGTAKQAAQVAAELIGLQNGPCDLACIYDGRCGIGNYSPLFNPMTYEPHKAYYAFTMFNELRKLGKAVGVPALPTGVYATAATDGGTNAAVMVANISGKPWRTALAFGDWEIVETRVIDGRRTDDIAAWPVEIADNTTWLLKLRRSRGDRPTVAMWSGFTRGMGFGGWLTNYKRFNVLPENRRLPITEGDLEHFDTYLTEADVARVASWGFDHVRVGFDQIVLEEKPGVWRERTFRRLDAFVGWCDRHGLNVVLNLHKAIGNYCDIKEKVELLDDTELQNRVVALWLELERRYHDKPGLAFELLNEVRNVDPEKWNRLADRTVKALREKNPDRWIVIGSTCWNSPGKLDRLKIWDDRRVVYTFHMYGPFSFTHQRGVLQSGPLAYNREMQYPTKDVARYRDYERVVNGKDDSFKELDEIGCQYLRNCLHGAYMFRKNHPDKVLWNGEFGTIRHAPKASRVAYMRDIVRICKEWGIPYCVWNYLSTPNDGNRFSLVDDETREFLSDDLLKACLGL